MNSKIRPGHSLLYVKYALWDVSEIGEILNLNSLKAQFLSWHSGWMKCANRMREQWQSFNYFLMAKAGLSLPEWHIL